MKVSAYAVLPAEVRYDSKLSPSAKLLYAEITAAATFEGLCDEDREYFAKYLKCDVRSVYRYVTELESAGHLLRERHKGARKLRIPTGFGKPSLNGQPEQSQEFYEEQLNFFEEFLTMYEQALNIQLSKKPLYYPIISERLKTFSRNELMDAMKNRINLIKGSEWHMENIGTVSDLSLLIRDDSTVHKHLNMKVETKDEVTLKPHKF